MSDLNKYKTQGLCRPGEYYVSKMRKPDGCNGYRVDESNPLSGWCCRVPDDIKQQLAGLNPPGKDKAQKRPVVDNASSDGNSKKRHKHDYTAQPNKDVIIFPTRDAMANAFPPKIQSTNIVQIVIDSDDSDNGNDGEDGTNACINKAAQLMRSAGGYICDLGMSIILKSIIQDLGPKRPDVWMVSGVLLYERLYNSTAALDDLTNGSRFFRNFNPKIHRHIIFSGNVSEQHWATVHINLEHRDEHGNISVFNYDSLSWSMPGQLVAKIPVLLEKLHTDVDMPFDRTKVRVHMVKTVYQELSDCGWYALEFFKGLIKYRGVGPMNMVNDMGMTKRSDLGYKYEQDYIDASRRKYANIIEAKCEQQRRPTGVDKHINQKAIQAPKHLPANLTRRKIIITQKFNNPVNCVGPPPTDLQPELPSVRKRQMPTTKSTSQPRVELAHESMQGFNEWVTSAAMDIIIGDLQKKYKRNRVYVANGTYPYLVLHDSMGGGDSHWLTMVLATFDNDPFFGVADAETAAGKFDITKFDKIVLVGNIKNMHWATVEIDLNPDADNYRIIRNYDSLPSSVLPKAVETRLALLVKALYARQKIEIDETKFYIEESKQVDQSNGIQCGIYALKTVEALLINGKADPEQMGMTHIDKNSRRRYSETDILNFRTIWTSVIRKVEQANTGSIAV